MNPTKLGNFRVKEKYLSIGIPRPDEGWNPETLKISKEEDLKRLKANAKKVGLKLQLKIETQADCVLACKFNLI